MRRARIKQAGGDGFYHVVSRICQRSFLLVGEEKGRLLECVRAAAKFSGVEIYSYAIMSNHFHLLVRVPSRKQSPSNAEVMRRAADLYGHAKFAKVVKKWQFWRDHGHEDLFNDELDRMRARMFDLSQFCKTFKETYTQDYNRRHENAGTIWEGRFKSILLEGNYRTLMTVSGYIHLNPVRAKVVDAPEKAQWTAFGDACGSDGEVARAGLCAMLARVYGAEAVSWERARSECERVMKGRMPETDGETPARVGAEASAADETPAEENAGLAGGAPAKADVTFADGGDEPPVPEAAGEPPPAGAPVREISLFGLLRRRAAGFLQGGALGGEAFIVALTALLPPRQRRRAKSLFDACPFLKLGTVTAVRESA